MDNHFLFYISNEQCHIIKKRTSKSCFDCKRFMPLRDPHSTYRGYQTPCLTDSQCYICIDLPEIPFAEYLQSVDAWPTLVASLGSGSALAKPPMIPETTPEMVPETARRHPSAVCYPGWTCCRSLPVPCTTLETLYGPNWIFLTESENCSYRSTRFIQGTFPRTPFPDG